MDITLVIMAAGIGSRFGGLKQATSVMDDGRCILDFSVSDAKNAGFNKVIFIVREDIIEEFKELVGNRISKTIPVEYLIQDTSILPEGRVKPFGTGHAILCCKDYIHEPFAIINSDDFYGPSAFKTIANHLMKNSGDYAMVSYLLKNTVSKNGTVTRGVCNVNSDNYLIDIDEVKKIDSECIAHLENEKKQLDENALISMNMWGLNPDIFDVLDIEFKKFLAKANLMSDEFYIPLIIGKAIKEYDKKVKVYSSSDKWFGMTYQEDLPELKEGIKTYIDRGFYD